MARFSKSILAAGTYRKNGDTIRVTPDDLQTALKSHAKIRERGYKIPVIMEHSKTNDKDGLPFKSKSEQISPRDLAKYQEGWSDTLRVNQFGELEADMDVLGADGLKLIETVGTYISPQFGRWADPETGEVLPMAITHLALTPFPVDINQNPEFRPLPDNTSITDASQLSHLVSFSMADLIDFGQKTFMFNEDDHPRDHGKFAPKSGGSTTVEDEPFTLKKEKSKKFAPKNSEGMQTNLLEKTKTTISPADSAVKKQVESLPGQKTIGDFDPEKHIQIAADSIDKLRKTDVYRLIDTAPEQHLEVIASYIKKNRPELAEEVDESVSDVTDERKPKQMSHFDAEAAVQQKLVQFSLAEQDWNQCESVQFGRSDQKRADDGKWVEESGGSTQTRSEPAAKPAKTPKKPKKGNHKKAESQAVEHHKLAAKASAAGDTLTARRHVAAAYGMHLAAKHYESGDHEAGHRAAEKAAKFAAGEIHFPDENYDAKSTKQMGQTMPFPPKPDSGDIDKDNDGIVDEVDDDFGTGLDDPDDDEDDAAEKAVEDHMPDKGDGDAETWAQIKVALKLNGVIVPDATNAHALLAGLLTAAHHTQKADTKDAMDDEPQEPEQPTQPDPQQQQTPAGGQDPRLKGTRQENAFTMSQTTEKTEVKTPKTDVKEIPLAEWTQMSQVNQKMSDRLTQLERDNYKKRIEHCFDTGRKNRPECDALMALANTFQFSHAEPTVDIIRLEAKLEDAEKLPEGAVWSPAERSSQMSLQVERQSGFFTTTGVMAADPAEEDADIARRFGPVPR